MSKTIRYLIVNFGGPRDQKEIFPFLQALLTDRDVIRTTWPKLLHTLFFSWVAKRRSRTIAKEYASMGGGSPIFGDTENLANELRKYLDGEILTFHRYIPSTHEAFKKRIEGGDSQEIRVFPLFPQFSYATTGSVAYWFQQNLSQKTLNRMRWIKSYAGHPSFVQTHQHVIREFLKERGLKDEEVVLLFSAHGLPQKFIDTGDIYQTECEASVFKIMQGFPKVMSKLSYQSQFGREQWLIPSTKNVSEQVKEWHERRPHVVFVPISFTSDHIETLCEIENDYMKAIKERGLQAWRIPALTMHPKWIEAIPHILDDPNVCSNEMLVRQRCGIC